VSNQVPVKPPKNNAEWARNVEKQLDTPDSSVRVGKWVLSTHPETGALIASHIDGGSVVLANQPAPSEDADAIASSGQPLIKLERQANQQEPRGTTALVLWDTVAYQTDEWGFVPTATDIGIPETGVYRITYHLAFLNQSSVTSKATVFLDGVVKMAQEFNPHTDEPWWESMYISEEFPLTAGTIVSCGAYVAGSGTFDFGASGADTSVYTSLVITKLAVD
jgi:hypothetical protein